MKALSILLIGIFATSIYAQNLSQFSDINIIDEDHGYHINSYNAKNDTAALEFSFGGITNLSEVSATNTISTNLTFYSQEFSYNIYGALNTLEVAAVTAYEDNTESLSVYTAGLGLSRRSILINDFISSETIYDEIRTNVTYNLADSEAFGVELSGLGFNAGYGLIWRISSGVHMSARLVYNLMALKSSQDSTPIDATASWVNAQAGLAFIF